MFLRLTSTASISSDLRQAQISQEATPPARGSLLASSLYHVQTCAYCSLSPTWELAEDPLPRLALLLIRQQALLVYRIPWDIDPRARTEQLVLARTPVTVTVAPEFRITVTLATLIVIATRQLTPPRCKGPSINGFAILGSGTRRIDVVTACLRGNR